MNWYKCNFFAPVQLLFQHWSQIWPKIEKQTKTRNETSSNLSLGERLTRLSKRLSRKRCRDTTLDRCQEGSRLTILLRIVTVKQCSVFFQNRGLLGSQGLKRTK
eukprot:UN02024